MKPWKIGLPMYWSCAPQEHRQLLLAILEGLRAHGWDDPVELVEQPDQLENFWRDDRLLLGQACGYPLMTSLHNKVRLIGTPAYDFEGCEQHRYCSFIVVSGTSAASGLADLRGLRAVFNQPHSQSGMNALRHAVAPFAGKGRFFSCVAESGSHRASLQQLAEGDADVAAVDCVTYGYLSQHEPQTVAGLRVLDRTGSVPGLPLITANSVGDDVFALLLRVVRQTLSTSPAATRLRLTGLAGTCPADYLAVLHMQQDAIRLHYPVLQ